MTDHLTPEARSALMAKVRRSGTAAERAFGRILRRARLSYRSQADLPGKPDFVLPAVRLAVFIDGDFWHGRGWFERGMAPKENSAFWIAKFNRNRARDMAADRRLRRAGWSVLRVWERDLLRDPHAVETLLRRRINDRVRSLEFTR